MITRYDAKTGKNMVMWLIFGLLSMNRVLFLAVKLP